MEFLTFHVGEREFAVPLDRVREILNPPPITRVPGVPPALLGLVGLRGDPTAVVDAGLRLAARPIVRTARTPLIVLSVRLLDRSVNLALLVEEAGRKLEVDSLLPWTEELARFAGADACVGFADVDRCMVLVLDVDQLFAFDRIAAASVRSLPPVETRPPGARPAPAATSIAVPLSEALRPAGPSAGGASPPSALPPSVSGSVHGESAPAAAARPVQGLQPSAVHVAERTVAPSTSAAQPPVAAAATVKPIPPPGAPALQGWAAQRGEGIAASMAEEASARAEPSPPGTSERPAPPPHPPSGPATAAFLSGLQPPGTAGSNRAAVDPPRAAAAPAPQPPRAVWKPEPLPPEEPLRPSPNANAGSRRQVGWLVAVAAILLLLLGALLLSMMGDGDRGKRAGGVAPSRSAGRSPPSEQIAPGFARAEPPTVPEPSAPPSPPPAAAAPLSPASPPTREPSPPPPPEATPAPTASRKARALPPAMVVTADTPACEIHQVKRGESLWRISARRLGDPYLWPKLYGENRDHIVNPDVIEVDDRIRIPGACNAPGAR